MPWEKQVTLEAAVTNDDLRLNLLPNGDGQIAIQVLVNTPLGIEQYAGVLNNAASLGLTAAERNAFQAALIKIRDHALTELGFTDVP